MLFTQGFAAAALPGWMGVTTSGWVSVAEGAMVAFDLVLVLKMIEVLVLEGWYEDERSVR